MMVLIQSMLRHLMTFGGGFLVADGVVTDADIQTGISAVVSLIGLGWSIYNGYKNKK